MKINNPYMNPSNSSDVDGNLFYFQDLLNPRITWRLYSQKGGKLEGPILTGFHVTDGKFGINHNWSNGLGNTFEVAAKEGLSKAVRSLGRGSRDIYNFLNTNQSGILGDIQELLNKGTSYATRGAGELYKYLGGSDLNFDAIQLSGMNLTDLVNESLTRSAMVTQGKLSKLYESTSISIPNISSLECMIWTTPKIDCLTAIQSLMDSESNIFLGEFETIADGRGGYWTAPNGVNLGLDNPIDNSNLVEGAFTLRMGPYLFRNLLISGFTWTYSKQFAAYPQSGKIKVTNKPAFASCSLDLMDYKYKTKESLKSTFIPQDTSFGGTTEIPEVYSSSKYNKN